MWSDKIIKITPALLFLFCLLEIFELGLIISNMNKSEKLEAGLTQSLESLEKATNLLGENGMGSEHCKKER
ncbi:hypothetical protein [Helicobacter phage 1961P]|uniref:Uncharacterized protein n=1 Tax=Helicobacter phage 1961P TaxID=1154995 RepID=I6NVW3_9CAUD|nr:hypothetical protein F419_gp23 [Helicobacter phage 1961P]AFC61922.1 hypothetical protein [Helicobacter phage 1961P]